MMHLELCDDGWLWSVLEFATFACRDRGNYEHMTLVGIIDQIRIPDFPNIPMSFTRIKAF